MEQSTNAFKYQLLKSNPQEIRLVLIQPGAFSSPIHCSLQHVSFRNSPRFEALSYVWGNPKVVTPIHLDERKFNVTINLSAAIQHLRSEDMVRVFWIDAISINQLDLDERGQQVQLMGDIYEAATRTTVWLGPETENSALGFEYMLEQAELEYAQELWRYSSKILGITIRSQELQRDFDMKGSDARLGENHSKSFDLLSRQTEAVGENRSLQSPEASLVNERTALFRERITLLGERTALVDGRIALLEKRIDMLRELKKVQHDAEEKYALSRQELVNSNARLKEIREELEKMGSKHARASRFTMSKGPQVFHSPEPQRQNAPRSSQRESTGPRSQISGFSHQGLDLTTLSTSTTESAPNEIVCEVVDQRPSTPTGDVVAELSQTTLERAIDGLDDTLRQAWWERVWVIQEIAMSADVIFQCGNYLVTWDELHATVHLGTAAAMDSDFSLVLNVLNASRSLRNRKGTQQTSAAQNDLLHVLQRFRYCKAADPRDKIYALLRLTDVLGDDAFKIDYTKSPEELYRKVVTFCLERQRSLDILGYVLTSEIPDMELPKLPSWVPDWSVKSRSRPFNHNWTSDNSAGTLYSSSGHLLVSMDTFAKSSDNDLLLKGFVFDIVADISECAYQLLDFIDTSEFYTPKQHLTVIQAWEEKALDAVGNSNPYPTHAAGLEAFWRTIIADAIDGTRAACETVHMFNVWSGRSEVPDGPGRIPEYFAEPYVNAIFEACNYRRFCVSSRKYMLLAPEETGIGDLICILLGGQTPFVLRECEGYFSLVGACYVHGIMDGEAMERAQGGEFEMRDFTLR
jgi:hypothetical protein